jgi:Ca2+-binding RTX toxin-like protein
VKGNAGADSLCGPDGNEALNTLEGVSGNDTLNGSAGTKVTDATENYLVHAEAEFSGMDRCS